MNLSEMGWNPFFDERFRQFENQDLFPARVGKEGRGSYQLFFEGYKAIAEVSGRFRHDARSQEEFPAVGDWVVAQMLTDEKKAVIQAVLPRKSAFIRQSAGSRAEGQVIAANVDTVFIVSGLDGGRNFNARRIERYLVLCAESGASPVAVLNKVDLCENIGELVSEAELAATGVPICVVSAKTGEGLEELFSWAKKGKTVALLGSSGVGKSALINAMLGSHEQTVGAVRADDLRGRHTTTHRELFFLPSGGMLIDTPGMRELQLWGDEDGVDMAFPDIEALAENCRFHDCNHMGNKGCAVEQALSDGSLDEGRYYSYVKLQKELAYSTRRLEQKHRSNSKARWKQIKKAYRKEQGNK